MTKANGGSNSGSAASRPGSKFGGSAGGDRRGKFANLQQPPASSSNDAAAAAAAAAKASKKRARTEGQARLLADLDEAEVTVLGMVALASETAAALSGLAGGVDATCSAAAAKQMAELGKKNGEDYLDRVARVHALLSPHAEKVVAYSNHEVDTAAAAAAAAAEGDEAAKSEAGSLEEKKNNNMYAAKVEMRLAIERKDVLKEFLRLEKEELGMEEEEDGNEEEDGRKPASGETNGGDATATSNAGSRKGKRRRAG
jgi:hypothetical protein